MTPTPVRPPESGHDSRYLRPEARRPIPRRRGRRGWKRIAAIGLRLALLAGAIGGLAAATEKFIASGTFAVRDIAVAGCTHARPEEIKARLAPVSGRNLFDVDLASVSSLAEEDSWVRSAEVRRRLPGTLQLAIEERRPAGVAAVDSRIMLVDEEGVVLAECGAVPVPCDSAVIRGLDGLPAPERALRIAAGVAALAEVARISPGLAQRLSEITVVPGAVRLETDDGGPALLLSPDEFGRNLENYASVEDRLRAGWPKLEYVDLRFRGRIAVLPAGAGPADSVAPASATAPHELPGAATARARTARRRR